MSSTKRQQKYLAHLPKQSKVANPEEQQHIIVGVKQQDIEDFNAFPGEMPLLPL
jgi:hypothetical protein